MNHSAKCFAILITVNVLSSFIFTHNILYFSYFIKEDKFTIFYKENETDTNVEKSFSLNF